MQKNQSWWTASPVAQGPYLKKSSWGPPPRGGIYSDDGRELRAPHVHHPSAWFQPRLIPQHPTCLWSHARLRGHIQMLTTAHMFSVCCEHRHTSLCRRGREGQTHLSQTQVLRLHMDTLR